MKPGIGNKEKVKKYHKYMEIKQHILVPSLDQKEIKREIKRYLRQMKMKTQHNNLMVCSKSSTKREAYSNKCLN